MSPIRIRPVLAGLAMLAALAAFAPAHAAPPIQIPVQILDPDGACESWNTGGTILAPTITCVKAAGGTPAPGVPVCSITANDVNPLNLTASALVALRASCTNTDGNTTWVWTGSGASPSTTGASPQQQSFTVSSTTTFTVVATNASGPSASRSVTVNVNPTAPPPPPPSGALSCPGYANTTVVDFTWAPKTQVLKAVSSGFGNSDIVVARFTTPANLARNGAYGYVSFVEYGGFSSERTAVLSTKECDFGVAADSTHGYWANGKVGTSGTVIFTSNINAGVALQPSTTYYFNINNMYYGAPKCGGLSCPIGVTLQTN